MTKEDQLKRRMSGTLLVGLAMASVCAGMHLEPQVDDQKALVSSSGDGELASGGRFLHLARWRRDVASGNEQQQQQKKKNKGKKKKNKNKENEKKAATDKAFGFITDCLNSHNKWRQIHGAPDLKWDTKVSGWPGYLLECK